MKKGLLDNVFSSVLMVILFLVFGFIMFSNTSKDIVRYFQNSEQIFLDEHFSNSLNTALKVDEPITKEPMSRLVTKRVFYRKEVLDIDGQLVNITDEFRKILDEVYGPDNYFVEVKALIYDLTLIFVFDGSDSMTEERAEIADKLPGIIEQLKQQTNFTIAEYIYVLGVTDRDRDDWVDLCRMFRNRDLTCEIIDSWDMYLPFYQNCADGDHPNADYRAKHCIIAPFVHNRWEMNNRQRPWQEWSERNRKNYYMVDWGSGIAYALAQTSTALSNLNIVFPISEELSTSSFAQRCYTDYQDGRYNSAAVTCDICELSDGDATIERAYRSVEGALRMSSEVLNDVIFPIYSYQDPCEYRYYDNNRHGCIVYEYGNPPGGGTWCGESRCQGCQDTGSRAGNDYVCFHPEVTDITLGHMQELADATAGSVVMIADKDRLADIINVKINDTLNNLFFTIGTKQNNTRYGFERMLTLPGLIGNFARLRLEVY